ncbi:MAG: tetratricopeptide repeat protein [Candidatus Sericytochromatia bacterium]|nr:tetratricopeptide repeat protein [Candidatus Sericytochromatia bacterium]
MKKTILVALLSSSFLSPAFATPSGITKDNYTDIKKLSEEVKNNPNDTGLLYLLANAYHKNNNTNEEIKIYNKITTMNPSFQYPYLNLGVIYADQGKTQQAINIYKQGIKNSKENKDIYLNLGTLYNQNKQYDNALSAYKAAVGGGGISDSTAYTMIGHTYEELGKKPEAEESYNKAINSEKVDYSSYINLGTFYYKNHRYDEAIKLYNKGLSLPVKDYHKEMMYSGLARNLTKLKKYDEAVNNLNSAIDLSKNNLRKSINYMSLGNAYEGQGKNDDAAKAFETSIKISPKFSDSYYNLGELYANNKQYDKAFEVYNTALNNIDSNKDLIYYGMAKTNEKKGDLIQAKSNYKKSCDLSNSASCDWLKKH